MKKNISFFNSALYYTLGVILAQGVTFLAQIVFANILGDASGVESYGSLTLYGMWANILGTIIGLEAASALNNARIHYGEGKLNVVASSLVSVGVGCLAVLIVLLLLFKDFFVTALGFPIEVIYMCIFQGFFFFVIMLIAQKCRVSGKPIQFVIWTSLVSILRFVISTVLLTLLKENKYLGDVYGSFISYVIVGVVALIFILKDGRVFANKEYIKYCLIISIPLVFHSLSSIILSSSDRYMVDMLSNKYQTGIYSFAHNIGAVSTAVWLAFNNAWTVWYFDKTKENKTEEILALFKKYVGAVSLLTFAIILLSQDIVGVLAGSTEYIAGKNLVPIIMGGGYFMFLYTFTIAYETYTRKTVYIAIGTICAAIINILLNLLFIPRIGAIGASITTFISYAVLFLFHYIIAKFIIKGFQINFTKFIVPALCMIGVVALSYIAADILVLRIGIAAVMVFFALRIYKDSKQIAMR